MRSELRRLLSGDELRRLAGQRSFVRGQQYAAGGAVRELVVDEDRVAARVTGTRPYRVRLWLEDGGLGHSCTCPVGEDGACCKHCVAVAQVVLSMGSPGARPAPPAVGSSDLRRYLAAQGKERLVELLMEQAELDDGLRRRLEAAAAAPR